MVKPKSRWPVQVRMSDLGSDHRVLPHRILEWCQDAATRASAAGGYPTARYVEMGAAWYIRAIVLQLPGTFEFDDEIEVETWVSHRRRFRSKREYLVYGDGEAKARASAEWMFLKLGADGQVRPYHLDDALLAAFPVDDRRAIEEGAVPAWKPDLNPLHRGQRTAHHSETDRYQHVNHVHYAAWVVDHYRTVRPEAGRLTQVKLHYQTDVKPGQTIDLEMEPTADPDGRVGAHHRLLREGQAIARAITRFA